MSGPVLSHILAGPPGPAVGGHQISVVRLDGTTTMTLAELHEGADRLARGLRAAGVAPGDRIGILASNCLEWVLLDLAALRLGAVTAGFEPGKFDPGDDLVSKYQLAALFTDRMGGQAGDEPGDRHDDSANGHHHNPSLRPIADVTRLIAGADPGIALPLPGYAPGDVTTIKFTSGSTGEPKGLAATAGSIDSSISAIQDLFEHGADDNLFLFLPLSLLQQRYWIYSALRYGHDVTVSTYEVAFAVLRRVAPTVVMGVPAFYETAMRHIERAAWRASSGQPASNGQPVSRALPAEGEPPADALATAARALLGDRVRYLWTGSAPARQSVLRFFARAGLPIYEGYGLNETCIVSKNHPRAHRTGSVGQVLAGKKVLIDADGVVSVWSEYPVNTSYEYAAPGDSERVFQSDGTVRTGDLGYLDEDGFLFIRGRADDVIVLDNGKKIIVRPIEEYLRACPAIEECVLLCPTQTHLVAVVSPASEPADDRAIQARVAAANATFGKDEQITELVIAPERFSVANGMLTSQFKPRRSQISDAYWNQASSRSGRAPADGN